MTKLIRNVSDTARWVAVYRAMESARPDALFRDPFAERLAGDRGKDIVDSMKQGRSMAWAMIVRTAVMDEIIMERIRGGGVDTVLNLAAGLDTRPWRLDLPATLRWIDVDLPEMIEYKTEHMRDVTPVCRYDAIKADLTVQQTRDALFAQVGRESSRILVVTEGLLIYLTEDDVTSLARALHSMPSAKWWLSDIASPALLVWMRKSWGGNVENAPFKFGPADSAAFFGALGWKELQFRNQMEEARRLDREMRGMWFWRFLMNFMPPKRKQEMKRFSGIILLERT